MGETSTPHGSSPLLVAGVQGTQPGLQERARAASRSREIHALGCWPGYRGDQQSYRDQRAELEERRGGGKRKQRSSNGCQGQGTDQESDGTRTSLAQVWANQQERERAAMAPQLPVGAPSVSGDSPAISARMVPGGVLAP